MAISPRTTPRTTSSRHDRGLQAVGRVREVRERDSLLGLLQAGAEHDALIGRWHQLEALLATHTAATATATASQWATRQGAVAAVAAATRQAEAAAGAAALVRTAALEHWQSDHSRVRAVQTLLERRAAVRREERDRVAARELDDLAGQRWQRLAATNTGDTGGAR